MNIDITIDDLSDGSIIKLLNEHLKEMHKYSPPESIHALDEDKLKDKSVTFWSARVNNELAGCGALKELNRHSAEIKSMKTVDGFLRKGVASKILKAILAEAEHRGYRKVSLETGSDDAFKPAILLYEKYGFCECDPFADYVLDPYSKFYEKVLYALSLQSPPT